MRLVRHARHGAERFLGLAPAGLSPSPFRASEIFLAAAFAFGGAIILQTLAAQIVPRWFPKAADGTLGTYDILLGSAFQLGLLAGLGHAWFWHLRPSRRAADAPSSPSAYPLPVPTAAPLSSSVPAAVSFAAALREGAMSFVTLLPLVWAVGFLWKGTLDLLGVDSSPQDIVSLFVATGDRVALGVMIVLAVLVAPVTEELVFRIGLFRWLRGRAPRAVVLFAPAAAFAALHGNTAAFLPLVVLAVVLSLAYERVGHPLVPIVAHSLFNLNTLALLLAGLPV
jgi:membrane protease YdiL (CAAX protease family)